MITFVGMPRCVGLLLQQVEELDWCWQWNRGLAELTSHVSSSAPRVSSLWAGCNTASLLALEKKKRKKNTDKHVILIATPKAKGYVPEHERNISFSQVRFNHRTVTLSQDFLHVQCYDGTYFHNPPFILSGPFLSGFAGAEDHYYVQLNNDH